ncbi:MAG: glycogen debranching enzyme family protein [Planctomycetes bacterium]|nr:glycogen debranching enzyme family protein [Planctomycetota bacterium]
MDAKAEWLEADGLGGFASGTVSGIRTRRYHALLLAATTPPTGRMLLVNGLEAWVETPGGKFALSSQAYPPDVVHPDGHRRIQAFTSDPWPRWTFAFEDGTVVEQEIFVTHGAPVTACVWRLKGAAKSARLSVRPLLSGRDYHSMHHENPSFRFDPETADGRLTYRPYGKGVPATVVLHNGDYHQQPEWFRNFVYAEERNRGLDFQEDLASPGSFHFDLTRGEAVWILAAEGSAPAPGLAAPAALENLRSAELKRRKAFPSRLHRSADAYVVRRGAGKTIVAGYPWFTDWGRDTFISLRGICLAAGRLDEARDILVEWAGAVSEGMLPNRFPDRGDTPEYNSVDASLWYVIAVQELLTAAEAAKRPLAPRDRQTLLRAAESILVGFSNGTRHGIRMDDDGLLSAGEPGVQLTWMDAKVGDWVVTPRIGKPVEIEALWLNALRIGGIFSERWARLYKRAWEAFRNRFWNATGNCLFDVVDVEQKKGTADPTVRPNQIFAVGGLPMQLLDGERARQVVDTVERRLWTPVGLRSLAPGSPGYVARYQGGVRERDGSYHMGTVWAWLLGPFVEAWVRVRGGTADAKREARARFLAPLLQHMEEAGLGHVSEIADGDPPHTPRGCPFQAWSVGEALRLDQVVLR